MQLLRAATSPAVASGAVAARRCAQRPLSLIAAPQRPAAAASASALLVGATAGACRQRSTSSTSSRRPALPPAGPTDAGPAPPAPALAAQPWLGTPEQEAALDEMRARFAAAAAADGGADAPPQPADELLRWYLRDRYFSVDNAEKKLRSMLEWRGRYASREAGGAGGALWEALGLPGVSEGDVGAELATGKAYVHDGPDAAGRPVLVVVARKHATGEYPLEDSKRMCMHLLDEVVRRLPATLDARSPGEEQMLGVFDLKGFELRNADLAFVAFLVEAFFEYYPRRVGEVLLVDAPWIFQAPWKAIRPLLRKYSALVRFVDRETLAREYFTSKGLAPPLREP